MDIHDVDVSSVKVPVADLSEQKPRKLAMQEPLEIDQDRAKAISAGFNNATGLKSVKRGE